MHPTDPRHRDAALDTWRGSWKFLAFGLFVLAYLVAIERPEWFVLRPATGTAVAMAHAADAPAEQNAGTARAKP